MIVNASDPLSVRIGEYYAAQRRILFQNMIRVAFPPGRTTLSSEEFGAIKGSADAQTMPRVQAFALTWAAPYRVDCMSITSAFAFGFDPAWCAEGCKPTRRSPYFDSRARSPATELALRPTMAIAAASFKEAKALIDRGVAADETLPAGTAYLLPSSDVPRGVRDPTYPEVERMLKGRVRARVLAEDALRDAKDVLFYFIGKDRVDALDTLRFVPGAIADHLTSAGGRLTDSVQMSAMRWLEAGADRELRHGRRALQSAAEVSAAGGAHRQLPARRHADRGVLEKRRDARPGHFHRRAARRTLPAPGRGALKCAAFATIR